MKKTPIIIISSFLVIAIAVTVIFFAVKRNKQEVSKEIEYQMGNYVSRRGIYGDGFLFIYEWKGELHYSTEMEDWQENNNTIIFKVDSKGNYEPFYVFDREINVKGQLDYYDEWLYAGINYDKTNDGDYFDIIRIHKDSGKPEVILTQEGRIIDFGIEGGTLYYGSRIDYGEDEVIYSFDLKQDISEVSAVQIGTEEDNDLFFRKYIYKDGADELKYDTNEMFGLGFENQFFEGYVYKWQRPDEGVAPKLYAPLQLYCTKYNGTGRIDIDDKVLSYNIFSSEIIYCKLNGDICEIWSCDTKGNNKKLINTIQTDERAKWGAELVVGEDVILCQMFDPEEFYLMGWYIVPRDGSAVKRLEYE